MEDYDEEDDEDFDDSGNSGSDDGEEGEDDMDEEGEDSAMIDASISGDELKHLGKVDVNAARPKRKRN